MDNISSLKISIDSSEVKNATNNLNNLSSTSSKAEKGVNTLRNAFATIGAGALAKQFIDTADSLKLLDARLKLATDSTKEFKSQQEQLLKISLQSYTAYSDTVTLFTKLNPALKQVGASTEQVNSVISSFTKGLQLGGSSAAEASSAILQFSQAMGKGTLNGEEFNAIAEASSKLMSYLAQGLGVTQGELKKMAANGELTAARVSNALLNVKDTIDKDFATLPVTVAKAMTNLSTATSLMIKDIDKSLGATSAIAKQIESLSNVINSISPEELENLLDLIKNTGIALAGGYTAIKSFNQGLELYEQSVKNSAIATEFHTKVQKANKLAIESGEKAVQLRILADKVAETGMINGEKATRAQISALNAEAKAAQLAATTNTANSYALQSTAKGFNLAAVASNTFKMALNTIPFMIIVSGLTAIATALMSSSKSAEILEKTLKSTNEELKKLTKNQLAYRQELLEEEIVRSRLIMADAKARAGKSSANAEDKANRDEAIKNFEEQTKKLRELKELQKDSSLNSGSSSTINADLKTKRNEVEIIKLLGSEYQKFNLALDESVKKAKELGASEAEINEFRAEELKKFNEKQEKSNKEAIKSTDELNNALKEMSQVGMNDHQLAIESIKEKTAEWIVAGVNINDVLAVQKQLLEELNIQQALNSASDELSFLEKKAQLMTDEYEKAKLLLEIKYAQSMIDIQSSNVPLEEKQMLIDKETELYNLTLQRIELDRNTEFQETMSGFYDDMLESQIELNSAIWDFGDGFEGASDKVSKLSKSLAALTNAELKNKKEREKIDKKYEKEFIKYAGDVEKTKELEIQYTKESDAVNQANFNNQIQGYANLAGAMSTFFEEGSAGAEVFAAAQKALSLVSLISGIMQQAALPYPYNILAMVSTAAVGFGLLGGGGGGGGGGSTASVPSVAATNQEDLDHSNKMITDRLDRQIELLEQLNLQGSAEKLRNISAGIQFDYEQSSARNTVREKMEENLGAWQGKDQVSIFNSLLSNVNYGGDLVDYFMAKSPVKVWKDYANKTTGGMGAWFSQYIDVSQRQFEEMQNEFQQSIADFTGAVVSSIQTLQSTNDALKETFDEITGSNKYAEIKLKESFNRVNSLRGALSFSEYLEKEIENIAKLDNELSDKNIALLLSQDIKDMRAQVELVNEISAKTGVVFENGAEDVLNYIDAIELVSETLVTSKNNMMEFVNSFKSEDMLLNQQSMKIGMPLAKDVDELVSQFKKLSSDMFGLTDDELEYLNTSKNMIEKKNEELLNAQKESIDKQIDSYNTYINTITKDISTIESAISSMSSIINKLREQADTTNTYTLSKFNESMSKTLSLMKGKDYKAIQESLKDTISYSGALSDAKNFELSRDMRYAQLVAANQFESMDATLQTEVDYLKQIEENTRATVLSLQVQLEKMTNSTISSNDKLAGLLDEYISNSENKNYKTVQDIYTKYDLHRFQTDNSGYEHWAKELDKGRTVSEVENEIKQATPIWINQKIQDLFTKYDLHQFQSDRSGYEFWAKKLSNRGTPSQIENEIKQTATAFIKNMNTPEASEWLKKFGSFAVGTPYVERDMLANIHQGEIITPKNFSDGLRNGDLVMGQTANMVTAINNMGALLSQNVANLENKLNAIISITGTQVSKLGDIYDVSNGSLVSLQNIEGII